MSLAFYFFFFSFPHFYSQTSTPRSCFHTHTLTPLPSLSISLADTPYPSLSVVALLGRFIGVKDANIRYLGILLFKTIQKIKDLFKIILSLILFDFIPFSCLYFHSHSHISSFLPFSRSSILSLST